MDIQSQMTELRSLSSVNPQREAGHRQIANEVWSALSRVDFSGSQFRVCMSIISRSWGFNKKSDAISARQIVADTGLSLRTVRDALRVLRKRRVIVSGPSRIVVHGTPVQEYQFNKFYDTWLTGETRKSARVSNPARVQKDVVTGAEKRHQRVSDPAPTKERKKDKEKDRGAALPPIPFEEIIDDLNAKAGTNYRHTTEAHRRAIRARFRDGFTLEDFKAVHSVKVAEWKSDPEMSKHLSPDTLYRPAKFEKYLNQATIKEASYGHSSAVPR